MIHRSPQGAEHRQLHDLRLAVGDIERELGGLQDEQRRLDADLAATRLHLATTNRQKFWRGFGFGLIAVASVWFAALGLAHVVVNP